MVCSWHQPLLTQKPRGLGHSLSEVWPAVKAPCPASDPAGPGHETGDCCGAPGMGLNLPQRTVAGQLSWISTPPGAPTGLLEATSSAQSPAAAPSGGQ